MRSSKLVATAALVAVPLACARSNTPESGSSTGASAEPQAGAMHGSRSSKGSRGSGVMGSRGSGMMGGGMMGGGMMGGGMMGSVADAGPHLTLTAQESKGVVTFKVASVDNTMAFNATTLKVKQGQKVHLMFHNNATSPALPHNWVLVKPGTAAQVAQAGIARGKKGDYVQPGPNVLAYTPLAGPGQTVDVTFTAPEPGSYPYICTVPGHYVAMKGHLVVSR